MTRPTSAHILAAQLEAAQANRPSQTRSPSSGQTSPSTPWLSDSHSTTTTSPMSSPDLSRRPPKLSSRPATARSREEDSDEDLEDELNDFGFGSTRKSKPKESLLDLLNSEPPAWMMEEQNVPPALSPRKSNLLQKKIRLGSGRSTTASAAEDPIARFSTLRSFKSTSSILGSRKSKSSVKGNDQVAEDDDFRRSMGAGTKKLSAKDAAPSPSSTRDLADFLRTSAPPLDRSSSSRTRSSTTGSIETATSGSARIMRAMVSKVGNGSRASLVRSNSGSSQQQRSIKEAVSPGAGSQFGDASLWRSNVLSPEGHEQEEALYESVSLRATDSLRHHSIASGRLPSPTSPGKFPRSASQESSLASLQLQRQPSVLSSPPSPVTSPSRAKRLSRKPVPRPDDLDASSPTSSSPSKPLISRDTLRLLQEANEDNTGRYTLNESPIKGRPAPAPLKTNGHLDRGSTMTFGPGLLSNGSSGSSRPRSELVPPSSPGASFASTSTSTSASRSPSDTDSPPSPRRARSTDAELDDSLIHAAMAFANLGGRDHRLRHDDSSAQSKGAALRRFPSPPPDHPLPSRPLSTARPISVSLPSSRPVSIAIHHPATFGASAARLSTLSDPDTIRRPPSVDSVIDPPLSGAPSNEERFDGKDTIFVALRLLRRAMRATADLPIDAERLAEEDEAGGMPRGKVEALLPTLKGLQSQMREAANLIEVVVRLAEKGPASREVEGDAKSEEHAEAFVVERMLGSGEEVGEEKAVEVGAESLDYKGLLIAEQETEEPQEEGGEVHSKRKSVDEESLFPLLVNEIDDSAHEAPTAAAL